MFVISHSFTRKWTILRKSELSRKELRKAQKRCVNLEVVVAREKD